MGVYDYETPASGTAATPGNAPMLTEQYLYGSSRLGVYTPSSGSATVSAMGARMFGRKSYELTDHLGDVRVALSDYQAPAAVGAGVAIVNSATDYYPFGMVARSYSSSQQYRYGFNGKMKDDEIVEGDYDFGARIYDSRIARWLAVDPHAYKYPSTSPYVYTLNNPVYLIDIDGRDVYIYDANMKLYAVFHTGGDDVYYQASRYISNDNEVMHYNADMKTDAIIVGANFGVSNGAAVGYGSEIVIYLRGSYRNVPMKFNYAYWGGSAGADSPIDYNVYQGFGFFYGNDFPNRSADIKPSDYEGVFYTTQTSFYSNFFGTQNNMPWGRPTWQGSIFSAGTSLGSFSFTRSNYTYDETYFKKIEKPVEPAKTIPNKTTTPQKQSGAKAPGPKKTDNVVDGGKNKINQHYRH